MSKLEEINNINQENELWVEKYRPKKISTFVGNKDSVLLIRKWINDFSTKNPAYKPILLLIGEPGVGKTTLANLILKESNFDVIEINASKLEGKSDIHKHFDNITRKGIGVIYSKNNKMGVVLDEVDGMAQNDATMTEFLTIIDPLDKKKDKNTKTKELKEKSKKTAFGFESKMKKSINQQIDSDEELSYQDMMIQKFDEMKKIKELQFAKFPYKYPIICTANKANDKRMKKLIRHAIVINLKKPTKQAFIKFSQKIVKAENIDIKKDALDLLIERSNYDFRQLISNLQMVAMNDDISISDVNMLVQGRDIDQNLFDIVYELLNKKNSIEDITSMVNSERRPISNMIYHNLIDIIDISRSGKRNTKVEIISKIMESIAEGQKFDKYIYDDNNTYNVVKNIIQPIMLSQELKIVSKDFHLNSYNIKNYRSQETKTYSNWVAYFIDKFGTYDTKTIFQLCYIIIDNLSQLNIDTDISNSKSINLMREYDIGVDDIPKMCKICTLIPNIDLIQTRLSSAKFKREVQKGINRINNKDTKKQSKTIKKNK